MCSHMRPTPPPTLSERIEAHHRKIQLIPGRHMNEREAHPFTRYALYLKGLLLYNSQLFSEAPFPCRTASNDHTTQDSG